jgi:hypothetical protein
MLTNEAIQPCSQLFESSKLSNNHVGSPVAAAFSLGSNKKRRTEVVSLQLNPYINNNPSTPLSQIETFNKKALDGLPLNESKLLSLTLDTISNMRIAIETLLNIPFILILTGQKGLYLFQRELVSEIEESNNNVKLDKQWHHGKRSVSMQFHSNWKILLNSWLQLVENEINCSITESNYTFVQTDISDNYNADRNENAHRLSPYCIFDSKCFPFAASATKIETPKLKAGRTRDYIMIMECGGLHVNKNISSSTTAEELACSLRIISSTAKIMESIELGLSFNRNRSSTTLRAMASMIGIKLSGCMVGVVCGWCESVKLALTSKHSLEIEIDTNRRSQDLNNDPNWEKKKTNVNSIHY